MTLAAIELTSPTGSAWEFLVLFLVVILGPPLVQRLRVPGLIGLLIGGFLIGPNGLGALDAGSTTIPDLGQLGLLYLMFVAGVELDLALLRRYRRSAISFGVLTFSLPMIGGTVVGFALGWSLAASLLLGSLLASHTLILYPLVRQAGLANNTVIASAVGATVLTDTLALVILAIIAGTTSGTGSTEEIVLELVLGMSTLLAFCFVALPFLVGRAFQLLGTERSVRYVIAVASFLAAAVVAETFGIEGIVGAFFAGLAVNRLVPNEGPLMDRIDFFGSAVFVPVFLVSVGLLLKPSVMFEPETLGLAALLIAACLGGKYLAAMLMRPLMGATAEEALLVFALTAPQAAATLASTTVGFQIGLFDEAVVNAVLVLILVSVVVSTLVAERYKTRVALPPQEARALGEHVLVVVADLDAAPLGLRLARSLARPLGGTVDVMLLEAAGDGHERHAALDRLSGLCRRISIDTDPIVRVTDHGARTAVLAGNDVDASLVVAAGDPQGWADLATPVGVPVAIVYGTLDRSTSTTNVVVSAEPDGPAGAVAAELVDAMTSRAKRRAPDDDDETSVFDELQPGEVAIVAVHDWEGLAAAHAPDEAGVILVHDRLVPAGGPVG